MASEIRSGPGEVLNNPATGEVAEIESSALAGAREAAIVFTLPGFARGAPPHHHSSYDETFIVISGVLEIRVGRALAARTLRAGESIMVKRGERHAFRNPTGEPVVFRTITSQGDGFERFIRAWYGLGSAGHFAGAAPRNPLHLAMALDAGDINLVGLSPRLQRAVRQGLVRLAERTGADRAVTDHWGAAHD